MKKNIYLILLFFLNTIFCFSERYTQTKFLLNTLVDITIEDCPEKKANKIANLAFEEIKKIEILMNRYSEQSELSLINKSASEKEINLSQDLFYVIKTAKKYYHLTNECFDITITPLISLWKKVKQSGFLPSDLEIKKTLSLIGFKKVILNEKKKTIYFTQKNMQIDLGGIAKGYAVDKAIVILKQHKIKKAIINAGGNLYVLGTPLNRKKWNIGIKNPYYQDQILHVLKLKNEAISTSGNYERFFDLQGKRYCHILNPKTGYPVQKMLSVTIIAPTAMDADALSTGVFVLGLEKGMELINSLPNVEGVIIIENKNNKDKMQIFFSRGMKKYSSSTYR